MICHAYVESKLHAEAEAEETKKRSVMRISLENVMLKSDEKCSFFSGCPLRIYDT